MYNFGRDDARLWRSTTPSGTPSLAGSQVSLRSRVSSEEGFGLPRERAIDVPTNFVAKPRRGQLHGPDPATPSPPASVAKKKRKLPRLKIRFTRKKRSAHVEWPPEALEAVEGATQASPAASVAESQPARRGSRVIPSFAERPPHMWADDVTSSGLGSSWETGLSMCSSSALERSGLARHPSLRPSVRRFLRASYGRSGSPSSDSFRRTTSCPADLSWGAGEPEHPAVPLCSGGAGTGEQADGEKAVMFVVGDGEEMEDVEGVAAGDAIASASVSTSFAAPASHPDLMTTSADHTSTSSRSIPVTNPNSDSSPCVIPNPSSGSSTPASNADTSSASVSHPSHSHNHEDAPQSSVSVQRTFATQLAHIRPVAAGIRHYWKVRHEEERLGTFHVQEASVEFEQLPRNIQPFVLYHRPLVAEIKTFWDRKRKTLRQKARNWNGKADGEQDHCERDSGGDVTCDVDGDVTCDGDGVVTVPVKRESGDVATEDVSSTKCQKGDSEPNQRGDVSSPMDVSTEPLGGGDSEDVTSKEPDAESVEQVRVDLDALPEQVDLDHLLPTVTRSRPKPPRSVRTSAAPRGAQVSRTDGDTSGNDVSDGQVSEARQSDTRPVPPDAVHLESLQESANEETDSLPVADSATSDVIQTDLSASRHTSPEIISAPHVTTIDATTAQNAEPTKPAATPHSITPQSPTEESHNLAVTTRHRTRPPKPTIAAVPIRAYSLESATSPGIGGPKLSRSSSDSTDTDIDRTDVESKERTRPADLARSSSFASAHSFWRSLQDLRPIQENERLRKKVSFREQQTQKRQDPVAVFFRHLLQKSESSHEVSRPPASRAPGPAPREVQQRSTLPVEPRRRLAHTDSLPNAVERREESKEIQQSGWAHFPEAELLAPPDQQRIHPQHLKETSGKPSESKVSPSVSPSERRLRQIGAKPVQPVAPLHLQRQSPATASSRRFIRPGVVRQLQMQFENMARQRN